jgi:hypothetical protein
MTQRYLIETPTSAVTIEGGVRKVIMVPRDSVIHMSLPVDGLQGLIEVSFNGGTVLMFAQDIRQWGKSLSMAST